MTDYNKMTDVELNAKINELSEILATTNAMSEEWDKIYAEYRELTGIQYERYYNENIGKLNAFYEKHIKGKKWDEINQDAWDYYSDWHKDVHGYRPRTI